MSAPKLIEVYKGFEIKINQWDNICIFYPDGILSPLCPGSIRAAKVMIDNYYDPFKDA